MKQALRAKTPIRPAGDIGLIRGLKQDNRLRGRLGMQGRAQKPDFANA
jgi:hypothetical protein